MVDPLVPPKEWLQWATPTQARYLEAIHEHGSATRAAAVLGVNQSTISKSMKYLGNKAAKQGYSPDHDMVHTAPDTHYVKGTSTLYGEDGQVVQQWVKTNAKAEDQAEAARVFAEALADDVGGKFKPVKAPSHCDDDLLVVYPMGDPHIGMYAYAEEAGDDFDLAIAERDIQAAVSHLTTAAPKASTGLVLNLGDYFHADTSANVTLRSNNALDVDTRWSKVLKIGARIMFWIVEKALRRHDKVIVVNRPGNHDDHSSVFLSLILDAYFRNEPRVEVDTSPAAMWYWQFGKVLIGSTHGHGPKPKDLPGIMAHDVPEMWGATLHRYWYTGHIHTTNRTEFPGVTWESFRTLAAKDAWHAASGYRSGRDMYAIVHHKDYGEIGRHRIDITRVKEAS